ncbi:MAG: SRPBCC domain-containing protein [Cyclobacteriaceae bacterium]
MEHIRHFVNINSPIDKVYEALATQEGLAKWWTETTVAKPEIGFVNEFRFGEGELKQLKVTSLKPDTYIEWLSVGGDEEWQDTKIIFNLESKDSKTILRFSHENWRNATDYFGNCNFHWGIFLGSLKMLCETGKGRTFQDMMNGN